jgi:hypothetical protein
MTEVHDPGEDFIFMNRPARYCEYCGKPLNVQARFCGQCGQPVRSEEVNPPAAPQPIHAQAETVLGVIPGGTRKKGLLGLGADLIYVVVTNQRLIFARQTNEMLTAERQQVQEAAKSQGKGFFGQWGAMLATPLGQRYQGMQPDLILREHIENFFYLPVHIRSVKTWNRHDPEYPNRDETYLEFDTVTGKLTLVYRSLNEKESKNLLRLLLGAVVR